MKYLNYGLLGLASVCLLVAPSSALAGGHVGVNVNVPGVHVGVNVGWGGRAFAPVSWGYGFYGARASVGVRVGVGGGFGFVNRYGGCMNGVCCFYSGGCF